MKTLICCMLLLVNSGIINNRTNHRVNKSRWPVSVLKVDAGQSQVNWHIAKITGTHDGTLNVYSGQLTLHNHKLSGGMILIDMHTIAVTDIGQPDKQKLETNLRGTNFFDTGRYTVARFNLTNVSYAARDNSLITVDGNLTMHGVTKGLTFEAKILSGDDKAFMARADLSINRRDWNIATGNFKYDHFISPVITLHIVLKASTVNS